MYLLDNITNKISFIRKLSSSEKGEGNILKKKIITILLYPIIWSFY